jgi:hypothetical protein
MLIRLVRYLLVVLTPLLISACVVMRECSIETLQPAQVLLDVPKQKIAVFASPTLFSDAMLSNVGTSDIYADSLISNILHSLKFFIEQSPGFAQADVSTFFVDQAEQIPEQFNYDWFIGLNRLQISNTYYGKYSFLAWESFLHVHYAATWSIQNKEKTFTEDYADRDLQIWRSGVDYGANLRANLPSIDDAWWDLGITIAHSCADYIAPHWQEETRSICMVNKFPDLSAQAYKAMLHEGYARAFDMWEEMLILCPKNGQRRAKSQITYNMAVTSEFEHKLDDAVKWAQQSVNYSANNANINYLQLLQKRKSQHLMLDRQIQ